MKVKFAKLHPDATIPTFKTPGSAGADVTACMRATIPARGRALVPTGLAIEVPVGYECQCRPRSGLAAKHGVTVFNTPGTVDSDYRGEMQVLLVNHTDQDYVVQPGDRIAQLVFAAVVQPDFEAVGYADLSITERGVGGWGSTGIK